jgi:hypothetical protein
VRSPALDLGCNGPLIRALASGIWRCQTSNFDDSEPPTKPTLPDDVQGFAARRVELVRRAVQEWTNQLFDRGGRNNLLHYRDLRRGTIDLTAADPERLSALLAGSSVRASSLFPESVDLEETLRLRTIYKKSRENLEERGLETLHFACGLATWENRAGTWEPSAPVLIRPAELRPVGAAQDDFELSLKDEMDVNQALQQFLKMEFDCDCDRDELLKQVDGDIDQLWELEKAYTWLKTQARQVPGFDVRPRLALANFAYTKLSMVRDLEAAFDQLVGHDLIAAIAGDEDARASVQSSVPDPSNIPRPDEVPVADEFLLLDADASQNYAINAVLSGESLIIKGPPGTGKSQTIANLIGALVARGRTVLFVAEKRAAIEAVFKRLHQHDLDDLVLDLHGGVVSRRAFAQRIARTLHAIRTTPKVEMAEEQHQLEKLRAELNRYAEVLHIKRSPWGVSIYATRSELTRFGVDGREPTRARFRDEALERLDAETQRKASDDLAEFSQLGGTTA